MEDGARVLSEHPRFALHASYELLLAYYKHASYREKALRHLGILKSSLHTVDQFESKREARWFSLVSVVESRLCRLQSEPDMKRAQAAAEAALRAARLAESPAVIAEAEIAFGEIRLAQKDARHAAIRFERAIENAAQNPKILAAAHLHRACALCRLGNMYAAYVARAEADAYIGQVEHGFIRQLASSVDTELRTAGVIFKDLRQLVKRAVHEKKKIDKQDLLDAVEWQLFQQVKAEGRDSHTLLRLGPRQFRRRYTQLRAKFGPATDS
jgi:hypothetical protein